MIHRDFSQETAMQRQGMHQVWLHHGDPKVETGHVEQGAHCTSVIAPR